MNGEVKGSPLRTLLTILLAAMLAFSVGFLSPGARPAEGHSASDYFPAVWAGSQIQYNIGTVSTLSRTGVRDAAVYGAGRWNAVADSSANLYLNRDTTTVSFSGDASCSDLDSTGIWVFGRAIDGASGTIANVIRCVRWAGAAYNTHAWMSFDTAEPWQWGSTLADSTRFDGRGTGVHEMGHALGFAGHFPRPSTGVCSSSVSTTDHTMCSGTQRGLNHKRTLETHDRHTLANAY